MRHSFLLLLSFVGLGAWACQDPVMDCMRDPQFGECSAFGNDGGGASDGGDVITPPGCDIAKSPKDSAPCVDDAVGVFVSPSGDDDAIGTKGAPVKSVSKGIELAAARRLPRVYVCEGTYDAAVEVKAPVSIFGGLSCAWAYSGVKPKLAPSKGVALRVTKATGAVLVEDFEMVGFADEEIPGDSAIAAFVSESDNVTFRNVVLTGGDATAGSKGATGSNWTGTAASGNETTTTTGAPEKMCTCADGTTSSNGGRGGTVNGLAPTDGSATPAIGAANAGSDGNTDCSNGTAGANGSGGAPGEPAPAPGKLSEVSWDTTRTGTTGANGGPGQGGGGGGSKATIHIGGGGGACGGCGGAGGTPGTNGGSSFALLSFQSNVAVESSVLVTSAAGRGGDGGDGQAGQPGGAVGTGACNGGAGGHGAGGSGGGGGAGGHSVPVAYLGTEPQVSDTTLTPGTEGSGGGGGSPGVGPGNAGAAGSKGPDGKAQASLAL